MKEITTGEVFTNKYGTKAIIKAIEIEIKNNKKTKVFTLETEKNEKVIATKIQLTKGSWEGKKEKKNREDDEEKKKKIEKNMAYDIHLSERQRGGYLLSIDQSTLGTGLSIISVDGEQEIVHTEIIPVDENTNYIKRTREIIIRLEELLKDYWIVCISIEGIYLDLSMAFKNMILAKISAYEKLSYLKSRIIELCLDYEIQFTVVPAATWKAYFKINYEKRNREEQKKMSQEIIETLTTRVYDHDVTDSLLQGRYVLENKIFFS